MPLRESPRAQAEDVIRFCKKLAGNHRDLLEMVLLLGEDLERDIIIESRDPVRLWCARFLQRYGRIGLGLSRSAAAAVGVERRNLLRLKDFSVFDSSTDL